MLAQAFGKASIVRIGEAPGGGDQEIQARFEILGPLGERASRESGFLSFQGQSLLQQSRLPGGRSAGLVRFWSRSSPSDLSADG